jgi:4-amino-4-deoxy-L-arabinose transferase-like glycosyltransferase
LYSETLYLFLLLLFTYSCLRMVEGAGHRWAVAGGVSLGLSVLMKPNLLLFPLLLGCWLWYTLRDLRQALKLGAIVASMMAVTVLPWVWRNYRVSGAFVPVSANGGLNLWQGNHPQADGAAYPLDQVDPLPGYTEAKRDSIYRQWAIEQIRSDPLHTLSLLPRKFFKFFAPLETSNRGRISSRFGPLIDVAWAIFLGLVLWGDYRVAHRSARPALSGIEEATTHHYRKWWLVYLLILYPLLLALVFYGGTRYGMVTHPYLFLLAAEPIAWLARRCKASSIIGGKQSA